MDLDVVISGNIDDFLTCGAQDDVILARNWNTPFKRLGRTSNYRFPVGAHLARAFAADLVRRFFRHLRSFTRPSGWVAEHWRE